jgi:hypothetical protein
VNSIALLCLVLLCTPVQLDCSLAALLADLLFTPVNTCSVYNLEALQADFEDPFLGPPTLLAHSIAVNTRHRSSLGITNPGIQALIVLD